jgi:hypothetical protein
MVILDWIFNRQWALVVGAVASALVWATDTYVDEIPPELIPVIAAVATMLNVWSNRSVDGLEDQIPTEVVEAGDLDISLGYHDGE